MNEELSRLYQKVCGYSPDDQSSEFSFSDRLAKENSWAPEYARRVVDEYKKFMFLAVAAGHPVTPSEQVDQAWHLHLIYTRSYWTEFCEKVLGKQIHHGPTKGGPKEEAKYRDWYERTKQSYRNILGEEPPEDIWPAAHIRFGDDLHFRRVNTKRNWVVSKKTFQRGAFVALAVVAVAALFVLAGEFARTIELTISHDTISLRTSSTQMTDAIHFPDKPGAGRHRSANAIQRTYSNRDLRPVRWDRPESRRERKHKQGSSNIFFVIVVVCIVTSLVLYGMIVGNRCPACGEFHALERTGNEREDRGLINSKTEEEWKCKLCGYMKWSTKSSSDGGCGGCGCGCGCGG